MIGDFIVDLFSKKCQRYFFNHFRLLYNLTQTNPELFPIKIKSIGTFLSKTFTFGDYKDIRAIDETSTLSFFDKRTSNIAIGEGIKKVMTNSDLELDVLSISKLLGLNDFR